VPLPFGADGYEPASSGLERFPFNECRVNAALSIGSTAECYVRRNLWRYTHVIRTLYAICLVALIGSTAWAATEWKAERESTPGRVGFVLLTILQR
jgi:hypothetical protein